VRALDELLTIDEFKDKLFVNHSCFGEEYQALKREISEQEMDGTHADESETSLMLAIAPDAVDMSKAFPSPNESPMPKGTLKRFDVDDPNYSPSGVYGDPTLATIEKGEKIAEARIKDLKRAISKLVPLWTG